MRWSRQWSPRLVRMTMSACSAIRASASAAPGTSVWRSISAGKNSSSMPQIALMLDRAAVGMGHRGEAAGLVREVDVVRARAATCRNAAPCAAALRRSRRSAAGASCFELAVRGDQRLGLDAELRGAGDQIGLVRFEEAEHAPTASPDRPPTPCRSAGVSPVTSSSRCARAGSASVQTSARKREHCGIVAGVWRGHCYRRR